ncbi:hypothetical protein DASC09_055260 [Saccharomycopsis crataegensis]|uniref:Kinesin motor domain-containing protein n=1 Tax=Saccharomycopsis crataegensis TaxID=43959 RepID=A0AAV5QTH5_9ASCO|nr:hypothetical protein DASC09_055260 [Saccharomycopsis crataegensis]
MSNGIPTYLRLKPFVGSSRKDSHSNVKVIDGHSIEIRDGSPTKTIPTFGFNRVFNSDTSQFKLFKSIGESLVNNVLKGNDSSIFTIGPSGSGKSFSTIGNTSHPGMLVYSLKQIFDKLGSLNGTMESTVKRCYLQHLAEYYGDSFVYNGQANVSKSSSLLSKKYFVTLNIFELWKDSIIDLLATGDNHPKRDIFIDSKDGKIRPVGLMYKHVEDLTEAQKIANSAIKKRHISRTEMNKSSSRSHIFININVHEISYGQVTTSRLNIVDLAGTERLRSTVDHLQRKEGNVTNASLSELGRVLQTISSLKKPLKESDKSILRTSKMTRLLLHDYLGNETHKLTILVNIDPFVNAKIILSVLNIIKPVENIINSESIKDTSFYSMSRSPGELYSNKSTTGSASQVRLVQSPGTTTRSAIVNRTSPQRKFVASSSSTSPVKLIHSPIKIESSSFNNTTDSNKFDSTSTTTNSSTSSLLRSPTRFIRHNKVNSELKQKITALESEVQTLKSQLSASAQYMAEMEFSIRQEAAKEYSEIISNIEENHRKLLQQFEETNIKTTDDKLEMLVKDSKEEIHRLRKDNRDLLKENSAAVTKYEQLLFKKQMDNKALMNLEQQINNFNNDNIRLDHENKKLREELSGKYSNSPSPIKSMSKDYAVELDQLRQSFILEHEKTVKEFQGKMAGLVDKLRLKTEKNRLLNEKIQKLQGGKIGNSLIYEDSKETLQRVNSLKESLQRSNSKDSGFQKNKNYKRKSNRINPGVLRKSLDTSINIMPETFKPAKKTSKTSKNTISKTTITKGQPVPYKKKTKKVLRKPKNYVVYENFE